MNTHFLNSITQKDLQAIKNTRIFVAGDVILDSYIEGRVSRISPEAPAPILLETQKKYVPGGAANVVANISNFGAYAQICGRIGLDTEAQILKDALKNFGVDTDALITESQVPTTTKTRIISHHEFTSNAHQLVRMDRETTEPIQTKTHEQAVKLFKNFVSLGGKCALVLSDYGKGFLTAELIQDLITLANQHQIPIIVDPKSTDIARYQNSTVIKPNLSEGRALYKTLNNSIKFESLEQEAQIIATHYLFTSKCRNIVMSLSQHGVIAVGQNLDQTQDNLNILRFATKALQVSDVSGAGDTLIAFLAMGLAAQLPFAKATELGNIAAGIVCGKLGTSVVNMDEIFEKTHSSYQKNSDEKCLTQQEILPILHDLKTQNKKIIFTNGCFDILHAGHIKYLQKAKTLGDILIIGLNSDESVKRLKGKSRPIQTGQDRAQILAALSCTDFIVEFNEDTPLNLILALKPDVLVKGADYNLFTTVGAQEVLSWGGEVVHLEFLEGRSTSSILNRI